MPRKIIWLVEECFSEPMVPIVDCLRNLQQEVRVVKPKPFSDCAELLPESFGEAKIMTLGSIQLLGKLNRWLSGEAGWADFKMFDCLTYYGYFGEYLLNNDYFVAPLNDLERLMKSRWALWDDQAFIRPTSGTKTFRADVYTSKTFQDIYNSLWGQDKHIPSLVAYPRKIKNEFRFFATRNRVIDGSQYRDSDRRYAVAPLSGPLAEEAKEFANMVLQEVDWRPEPMFVMDVCIEPNGPKIVELNSFSCSGWYATPPFPVLEKAIQIYSNLE